MVQGDGKILVAGSFTTLGGGGTGTTARKTWAASTAGGALDTGFNPARRTEVGITALAVQQDGKILVRGRRLNVDGSLDTSFNPAREGERRLAVQADGKILVGGSFTTLGGGGTGTTTRNYIGRLNADGSLDTSFDPGAND